MEQFSSASRLVLRREFSLSETGYASVGLESLVSIPQVTSVLIYQVSVLFTGCRLPGHIFLFQKAFYPGPVPSGPHCLSSPMVSSLMLALLDLGVSVSLAVSSEVLVFGLLDFMAQGWSHVHSLLVSMGCFCF